MGFCPDGVAGSPTAATFNFDSNSAMRPSCSAMRLDAAKSARPRISGLNSASASDCASVNCPVRAAATSLLASASVPISQSIPPAYTTFPDRASRNNRNLKSFFAVHFAPATCYIHCTSVKCYITPCHRKRASRDQRRRLAIDTSRHNPRIAPNNMTVDKAMSPIIS